MGASILVVRFLLSSQPGLEHQPYRIFTTVGHISAPEIKTAGQFMQIDTDTAARVASTLRAERPATQTDAGRAPEHEALWHVAQDLEATFIAEMLKHSGLGPTSGPFSGGPGEEHFNSFLTQEHARLFTERGGIGLAESIFRALTAQAGEP
jgi:Rod binding domain-containing protein